MRAAASTLSFGGYANKQMRFLFPQLSGFGFAIIFGTLATWLLADVMWKCIGWKQSDDPDYFRPDRWQPLAIGIIERILYVATLRIGEGKFIGFWLALKVAGQWQRWGKEQKLGGITVEGRSIYQIFLIGNAFSVLYALVGAKMIDWYTLPSRFQFFAIPTLVITGTCLFWLWLYVLWTPSNKSLDASGGSASRN